MRRVAHMLPAPLGSPRRPGPTAHEPACAAPCGNPIKTTSSPCTGSADAPSKPRRRPRATSQSTGRRRGGAFGAGAGVAVGDGGVGRAAAAGRVLRDGVLPARRGSSTCAAAGRGARAERGALLPVASAATAVTRWARLHWAILRHWLRRRRGALSARSVAGLSTVGAGSLAAAEARSPLFLILHGRVVTGATAAGASGPLLGRQAAERPAAE